MPPKNVADIKACSRECIPTIRLFRYDVKETPSIDKDKSEMKEDTNRATN